MEMPETILTPENVKYPAFRSFRHKNFSLFFSGQLISLVGTWSQSLAISWLVWRLTGSAAWLGFVWFMIQFPMLIFGLPGGALADRFDRLKALTLMQVFCMLQAVALAALTIFGKIELWHVVLLSAMLGAIYSFEFPIRQTFIMDMVGRKDLLNAVSINAAMFHATRALGPAVAGFVVAWQGEGVCFLFNAATFVFLIAMLLFVDRRLLMPVSKESAPMWDSIKGGLKFIRSDAWTTLSLTLVAAVSVFGMAYVSLMPVFADDVFGGGSMQLGWLMGTSGAGSFTGAVLLARRRSNRGLMKTAMLAALLFACALIALGFIRSVWPALPVMAAMGFSAVLVFASISTLLQERTPNHMRGRVMSLFTMIFMGIGPFGNLAAGFVAEEIGASATVIIFGALLFACGLAVGARARHLRKLLNVKTR